MKKFLTFVFIFIISFSFAQPDIEIHLDDDPGTNYNGQTINITQSNASYYVYMHLFNASNADVDILFRRVILDSDAVFYDQFCDDNLCFPCSGVDWTAPSSIIVSPGDSTLMKPQGSFTSEGFVKIRYYIINNTTSVTLDSVDVNITYSTATGIANDSRHDISLYPNPSNESLNINVSNEYSGIKTITLTNINGKTVYLKTVKNGLNNINLLDYQSGIYFCRFSVDNKTVFNEKLIVRH
jgi:hypothetical protein